jgi:hypothetical protein
MAYDGAGRPARTGTGTGTGMGTGKVGDGQRARSIPFIASTRGPFTASTRGREQLGVPTSSIQLPTSNSYFARTMRTPASTIAAPRTEYGVRRSPSQRVPAISATTGVRLEKTAVRVPPRTWTPRYQIR